MTAAVAPPNEYLRKVARGPFDPHNFFLHLISLVFGHWSLVFVLQHLSDFALLGWIRTLDFERENSGTLKTFLFAQKDCHQNADGKSFGIGVLHISWQPYVLCRVQCIAASIVFPYI